MYARRKWVKISVDASSHRLGTVLLQDEQPITYVSILQIQIYPLVVAYRPGKELVLADTLSRAPTQDQSTDI